MKQSKLMALGNDRTLMLLVPLFRRTNLAIVIADCRRGHRHHRCCCAKTLM